MEYCLSSESCREKKIKEKYNCQVAIKRKWLMEGDWKAVPGLLGVKELFRSVQIFNKGQVQIQGDPRQVSWTWSLLGFDGRARVMHSKLAECSGEGSLPKASKFCKKKIKTLQVNYEKRKFFSRTLKPCRRM